MKYGVCAHPWALTERDFQEMRTLGVKYVRMDFRWPDIERTRDAPWNFTESGVWSPKSSYDTFVAWSKQYGIEIIACLLAFPDWILPGEVNVPPAGAAFDDAVAQFGDFVYAVVDHYKGDITYFEIWNEPGSNGSWKDPEGTPMPSGGGFIGEAIRKYVMLLQEAYTQAKAANPNCVIISGGQGNLEILFQQMYDYGAKGYFDILGSHPYFVHSPTKNYDVDYIDPAGHPWHFPKIQYLRDIMVAEGDGAKNMLITEIGIDDQLCPEHTTPAPSNPAPEGHTTLEMQADRLTRVFQKTMQEYPYVEGIMWYQLKDTHKAFGAVPVTPTNFGLFRMNGAWDPDYPNVVDYTPRPMYYAYKRVIQSGLTLPKLLGLGALFLLLLTGKPSI